MKAINIKDAVDVSPFRPFHIHTNSGKIIPVRHPDLLNFNQSETTLVVVDGDHFHIVDLDNISSLELPKVRSVKQAA